MSDLVDLWIDRRSEGNAVSVDQLCEQHGCPELAPELARRLGKLRAFDEAFGTGVPEREVGIEWPPTAQGGGEGACRLELCEEIDSGGMGVVYRARDAVFERELAVKVLLDRHLDNPGLVRRFREEARIAGQLQHPGIAPVHEVGTLADGRPYFSMKLIKGLTLSKILSARRYPAHELDKHLTTFLRVAETMAYVHSQGVIHRDLKPSNIMVGAFGEVQVMDWGLAKVLSRDDFSEDAAADRSDLRGGRVFTQAGSIKGTPAYMAPEQAAGKAEAFDERSDVFSLGSILCEILTGGPAFTGRTSGELLRKAALGDLAEAFARLNALETDAELTDLAKACLAPVREDRPRDAGKVEKKITGLLTSVKERLRAAAVERAVLEAELHAESARKSPPGDLADWRASLSAAQRAEALLVGIDEDDNLGARVAAVREAIDIDYDRARKEAEAIELDRWMTERLIEIRVDRSDHFEDARTDADYTGAFRGYGVDMDVVPTVEAAARLSRRPGMSPILASALDDWSEARRADGDESGDGRIKPLIEVAAALDPDPWRQRLRRLQLIDDPVERRNAVIAVAEEAVVASLSAETLDRMGRALVASREYARAAALLRPAQRKTPDDIWINYDLGIALYKMPSPDLAGAVRFLTAARAIRPEIGHTLAHALADTGQLDEALALFEDLVLRRPSNPHHHFCLGLRLSGEGRDLEATCVTRKAVQLLAEFPNAQMAIARQALSVHVLKTRNPEIVMRLIDEDMELTDEESQDASHPQFTSALTRDELVREAYRSLSKGYGVETSVESASNAVRLSPYSPRIHATLGDMLRLTSGDGDGLAPYRMALRLDPEYRSVLAVLAEHSQLHDEAIQDQDAANVPEAGSSSVDAADLVGRAAALLARGRFRAAAAMLRAAVRFGPAIPGIFSRLGDVLFDLGEYTESLDSYGKAIRRDPQDWLAHHAMGHALGAMGRWDEAAESYRACAVIKPKWPYSHAYLGRALLRSGHAAEALEPLDRACLLTEDHPPSWRWRGEALSRLGRDAEALAAYRRAMGLDDEDPAAYHGLGDILVRQGRSEEAIESYRTAARLAPGAEVGEKLGSVLMREGRIAEAELVYCEAVASDAGSASAFCGLGKVLRGLERHDEAIEAYRVALRLSPEGFDDHFGLGYSLDVLDRVEDAIVAYREAARLGPGSGVAYHNLGLLLRRCGRLREAEAAHHEATRHEAQWSHAWRGFAGVLGELGRWDEAIAHWEEAIRLDTEDRDLPYYLASAQYRSGRLEDAIRSLGLGASAAPTDADYPSLLGSVLADSGRFDDAVAAFLAAAEIRGADPQIQVALGGVLRGLGRFSEARAAFQEAIRLGHTFDEIELRDHERDIELAPGPAVTNLLIG